MSCVRLNFNALANYQWLGYDRDEPGFESQHRQEYFSLYRTVINLPWGPASYPFDGYQYSLLE